MPSRFWILILLAALSVGCRSNSPPYMQEEAKSEHGSNPAAHEEKFAWGPAAPEPPLMPSAVPPIPEPGDQGMTPGEGPTMQDKLIPSTSEPNRK